MNRGIVIFILLGFIFSCNSDDDSNTSERTVIGTWKLTANLMDPGDGSGSFETVDSEKLISFNADGTVSSNGLLCSMSVDANNPSSGIYTLTDFSIDADCESMLWPLSFSINANILIINYPCIEPCQSKYLKIK